MNPEPDAITAVTPFVAILMASVTIGLAVRLLARVCDCLSAFVIEEKED